MENQEQVQEQVQQEPTTNIVDYLYSKDKSACIQQYFENPPKVTIIKTDPNAVIPSKAQGSDVGYDLTIIKIKKTLNDNTIMYDTGIQARVPWGYYLEILPRSSLSKTGWILANSVGVIDPSYTGNLLVVVTRTDPIIEDLELPFKGFQLVVRKQYHMDIVVDNINSHVVTNRGDGGFGSTG